MVLWAFPLLLALASAAKIDEFSSNCTNLCTQGDSDKTCWYKTLDYVNGRLVRSMWDFVTVQVDIDQWEYRHNSTHKKFDLAGALKAAEEAWKAKLAEQDGHVDEKTQKPLWNLAFESAAKGLLNIVNATSKALIHDPPLFHCPVSCGYDSRLWLYLFIGSAALNICLLLSVLPSIYRLERRRSAAVPYSLQN